MIGIIIHIPFNNSYPNVITIFNKQCPANIFAPKRIPKLIPRAIYDIISIQVNNRINNFRVPFRTYNPIIFSPCFFIPIIVNPIIIIILHPIVIIK
jgi:hypothetical protein